MYAVISGEKTFTLLPPTDIIYLDEKEYPTSKYRTKSNRGDSSINANGQLMKRLKAADLELTEDDCPSGTITWLSSDPEDPLIEIKNPAFENAHPLRCKVQAGEILYIPGIYTLTPNPITYNL
jgi:jumonji domain-containing protein 7